MTTTASKSACPSPETLYEIFLKGLENIVVVTIIEPSGSYNSRQAANKDLSKEQSNNNIHVINSLSAGGEVDHQVRQAQSVIAEGL